MEDCEDDAALLLIELRRGHWEITHQRVDTPQGMSAALDVHPWDLIIADYAMPNFSGPAALIIARQRAADIPFILVSGQTGEEPAVQAMRAGADDYLFKGDLKRLVPAVQRELRDLEGRRKAEHTERQLKKGERQLADAQRLAHLGTWHVDLRTSIAIWSDEACRILGCQIGEAGLTFQHFLGCLHVDDRHLINACLNSSDQILIAQDCRIACPNVAAGFVHIRGEIIRDVNGNAIEATGMIQDITERYLVDAQLKDAKEAAEAANRAKSEFLANMSHEIRTPMTAILGFADMILQPDQSEEGRVECVQVIRRNGTYLLELINHILDLSKIEEGQMTIENIPCEIAPLLADIVTLVRHRAVEKGLEFNVKFECPIPRFIQTDPLRLRQILVNLLGNAIKFTPAGKITMTIRCEGSGAGHLLCAEVVDSGIGMNPEQLDRLFRPFSQADESITRKFGGTGLGLTISRQLARLLGGEIEVKSTLGVGSTFTMRIDGGSFAGVEMLTDLHEKTLPSVAPADKWQNIPLHGRILLVEDGRDNQRLLSAHLRACGAEVVIAENGQIAVDLAVKSAFDLILMDMQMPVMDGYTAAAELRRQGFTTPIIALTAYAMAQDRKKCMASGCTDYLSKPIDRDVLLKTVSQYLGKTLPATRPNQSSASPIVANTMTPIKSSIAEHPGMMTIITEFVDGLPGEVRKMTEFLEQNDMASLRRVVHQMRGAGGGYGFTPLTELATKAEGSIAASDNLKSTTADVKALIDVMRQIEGYDEGKANVTAQAPAQ